jgi:hypothetical protein
MPQPKRTKKFESPLYDVPAVADTLLLLASLLLLVVRDVPVMSAVAGNSSVGKNTPAADAAVDPAVADDIAAFCVL